MRQGTTHSVAFHRSLAQAVKTLVHLFGMTPVIRRARLLPGLRADVGALFDAGHVVRVRAVVVTAGPFPRVELDEHAGSDGFGTEQLLFRLVPMTPENAVRLAVVGHFRNPGFDGFVCGVAGSGIHQLCSRGLPATGGRAHVCIFTADLVTGNPRDYGLDHGWSTPPGLAMS